MTDKLLLYILSITGSPSEAVDIATLVSIESDWQSAAESDRGAVGLLQITPIAHYDVLNRIKPEWGEDKYGFATGEMGDLKDPEYNLKIGVAYWKWILSTTQGKPQIRALAAWNWGYGNTRGWGGEFPALPAETQEFIRRFKERRKKYEEKVRKLLTMDRHCV